MVIMQRPRLLHCVPLIASLMIWPNLSTNSHIRVHTCHMCIHVTYMHVTCIACIYSSWKHSRTVMEKIISVNGFPACHCGPPSYLVRVVLDYELHSAHHKDSMYMMTPGSWNGPPSLPRRAACQPGDLAKSIHIIHSYQLFRFLNLSFLNRCMGQHPFV